MKNNRSRAPPKSGNPLTACATRQRTSNKKTFVGIYSTRFPAIVKRKLKEDINGF